MTRLTKVILGLLSVAILASTQATAAPLAIAEHSFEVLDATCGANTWCNEIGPEWTATNDGGATTTTNDGNFFKETIGGFSADGTNHIGVQTGWALFQVVGTFQSNTLYTMTAGLGNRDASFTVSGNTSTFGLIDGGTGAIVGASTVDASVLPAGTFADYSTTFNTATNPALVGQPLGVAIANLDLTSGAGGPGRAHFDNIRLDAAPVPEPSGLVCMGMLLAGLGLRLRRK